MAVPVDIGTLGTPPSGGSNLEMNLPPPEGGVPINVLWCQCYLFTADFHSIHSSAQAFAQAALTASLEMFATVCPASGVTVQSAC